MTTILGIRHHGPGSARSVLAELERLQPDALLVEGPSDASNLIDLIVDPGMRPPVALLDLRARRATRRDVLSDGGIQPGVGGAALGARAWRPRQVHRSRGGCPVRGRQGGVRAPDGRSHGRRSGRSRRRRSRGGGGRHPTRRTSRTFATTRSPSSRKPPVRRTANGSGTGWSSHDAIPGTCSPPSRKR